MPIFNYHGGPRFEFDRRDPSVMGLEIECYVKRSVDISQFTDDCYNIGGISPERDSSLDYNRGVEFVFKPVPFESLSGSHIQRWSELAHGKVKAWGQSCHGMHISMNIGPWQNLHVSMFRNFVVSNRTFFEKIAGREQNGYCRYELANYHGSAVNTSGDRMEVRIFQASANFRRISLNFQLLDCLRKFIENNPVALQTLPRFKRFAISNEGRYPYLASYFQRSYYGQSVSSV